ncbi:MAG: carboxypeptidase-like regulatory domain-containing protein [Algisphaera sp.]
MNTPALVFNPHDDEIPKHYYSKGVSSDVDLDEVAESHLVKRLQIIGVPREIFPLSEKIYDRRSWNKLVGGRPKRVLPVAWPENEGPPPPISPRETKENWDRIRSEMEKQEDQITAMARSFSVHGVVVNTKGKGVPNALVRLENGEQGRGGEPLETTTDALGAFLFLNARPGRFVLLVTAQGYGPSKRGVSIKSARGGNDVGMEVLGEARTLRGRVVDEAGHPLEGVVVSLDSWAGGRQLVFETQTDEQGAWEWTNAPASGLKFRLYGEGHLLVDNLMLAAQDEPHEITMFTPLLVHGRVTDAETGEVIEHATVTPATVYGDSGGMHQWGRDEKGLEAGTYEMRFRWPADFYHVVVKAEGYAPVVSPGYESLSKTRIVVFDAAMKADVGVFGRVVDAQGQAVVGAQVYVAIGLKRFSVRDGRFVTSLLDGDESFVVTDDEGWFTAPTPVGEGEVYTFLVLSDGGVAMATVAAEEVREDVPEMVIEAWGRVEGKVRRGTEAYAGQEIVVSNSTRQGGVRFEYNGVLDTTGQFVIERMAPQEMSVRRKRNNKGGSSWTDPTVTQVDVKSGETSTVIVEGVGDQ